jgi:hypothetical protein
MSRDKLLVKAESIPEIKRTVNILKGKANEITVYYLVSIQINILNETLFFQSNAAKYLKDPKEIDFAAYKGKLKFSAAAVEKLEVNNLYKPQKFKF